MKKQFITLCLFCLSINAIAQTYTSNFILVRHDTSLLKSNDCEWIIKSLVKNDPALTAEIGKSLPLVIMEAIEKGKLKAIDPETNKPIPAGEIFTWKMGVDTVSVFDENGNYTKYMSVQRRINPTHISQIRIFQDWYFDITKGIMKTEIKWIELLIEIVTQSGISLGHAALCRIYY